MPRKTIADLRGPQEGSQGYRKTCGAIFDAFDGEQVCGRPAGHEGAHTRTPLPGEKAQVSPTLRARQESYAVVGIDSSLSAVSAVALGYDAKTNKTSVEHGEIRWSPETDYFERMKLAAGSHDLVLDLLRRLWAIDLDRVFVAMEEPFPFGMLGGKSANFQASYAKQLAEISGAVKGSLARWGFVNMKEVNNASWHKDLRQDGVEFLTIPRGTRGAAKTAIQLANKFKIKEWAIERYGLPEFPDLVASKSGAKIPRPESGYGAKAKAVQADDRYDACAVMHHYHMELVEMNVIERRPLALSLMSAPTPQPAKAAQNARSTSQPLK